MYSASVIDMILQIYLVPSYFQTKFWNDPTLTDFCLAFDGQGQLYLTFTNISLIMYRSLIAIVTIATLSSFCLSAQDIELISDDWQVHNRNADYEQGEIHLDAQKGDGVILHNSMQFENGEIEFDLKGEDIRGKSFVGFAFHHVNESTFDAIYFRPFNFQNPTKRGNSVQYISMPEYEWSKLRKDYPGVFENEANPIPQPVDDWFHVKLVIEYPVVKVYINDSTDATLEIKQKSNQKKGQLGFWVGNNSQGWFKNLSIIQKQ